MMFSAIESKVDTSIKQYRTISQNPAVVIYRVPNALFGLSSRNVSPKRSFIFFLKKPEKVFIFFQKKPPNFQEMELFFFFLKKNYFLYFGKGIFRTLA